MLHSHLQPIFRQRHQFRRRPIFLRSITGLDSTSAATWALAGAGSAPETSPTRLAARLRRLTNTQFVGGAQVGANYQFWGGVVIGAEAMFDWLTVSHNNPVTATDPTNTVAVNLGVADARWLSTATGKVGYAWDRVLLYAKGGGAWVATTSPSISVGGVPASFSGVSSTTTSTWTAGFGLEWAFSGNWSARAEYDYIALPNQSFTVAPATPTFGGDTDQLQQSQSFDLHRGDQLQVRRLVAMKLSPLKLEPLAIASLEASWAEAPNLNEISMKRARLVFALTVGAASAEPKSALPGNGIFRPGTNAPKRRRSSRHGARETKPTHRTPPIRS